MNAAVGLMEVRVPDMGNFKDVAVIDVLVKPGDSDRSRHAARHARDREGDHGRAVHREAACVEKVHATKGGKVNRRRPDRDA